MSTRPLNFALFGAGNIGKRHLRLAHEETQCNVVAVADPAPDSAAIAAEFGARHYTSAADLLAREPDLDGAIIATPNNQHVNVGIACVEHKIPILVEKPVADTLAGGEALIAAAKQHGVPLLWVIIGVSTPVLMQQSQP